MICVTLNNQKLIFGSGAKVFVHHEEDVPPEFYKLQNGESRICLATGFTRHNATATHQLFNDSASARFSSSTGSLPGTYSQVAFLNEGEEARCDETNIEDLCHATLEPDPIVNLASLTIYCLRLLFLKTVVFNVLMTLRLWISP